MKNCPYCGEEILETAKKCKHCGEWLEVKKKKKELIPCPCCGEEIEAGTESCIHCNEQLPNNKSYTVTNNMNFQGAIIVSILSLFVGVRMLYADIEANYFEKLIISTTVFSTWQWVYFKKFISHYGNQNRRIINWIIAINVLGGFYLFDSYSYYLDEFLIVLCALYIALLIVLGCRLLKITDGPVNLLKHLSISIFITQPIAFAIALLSIDTDMHPLTGLIEMYPYFVILWIFIRAWQNERKSKRLYQK